MTKAKAFLIYLLYRLLMFTWRVDWQIHPKTKSLLDNHQPLVLAHWHGDELALIHLVKPLRLATMTSTSRDGQAIDFVIRMLGGTSSKGSSTRGGATGLRGLIKLLRSGRVTSVAVDGPRGPRHKVKPGVFELARLAEASIIPVGAHCRHAFHFPNSWNKIYLPLPFAKVSVVFAEPYQHLGPVLDPRSTDEQEKLALRLNAAGQAAANSVAAL